MRMQEKINTPDLLFKLSILVWGAWQRLTDKAKVYSHVQR